MTSKPTAEGAESVTVQMNSRAWRVTADRRRAWVVFQRGAAVDFDWQKVTPTTLYPRPPRLMEHSLRRRGYADLLAKRPSA